MNSGKLALLGAICCWSETVETGIRKTVEWYLANPDWVAHVQSGSYRDWVAKQYTNEVQPA